MALALLVAVVASCAEQESVAERRARPTRTPDVDRAGTLFGAWVSRAEEDSRHRRRGAEADLERSLGTRLGIRHYFYAWDEIPDGRREAQAIQEGVLPLVSWNDGDNRALARGRDDERIRQAARTLGALPGRVLLRFGWEMDRDARTGTGSIGPPGDFIAAWKHLRQVVREEGADNVEFVWCATSWGFRPGSGRDPRRWYPGDDQVDWVCADGYNLSLHGPGWRSFDDIFGPFLRWAERRDKPIMIGELGVAEDPDDPDRRARWLRDMAESVKCRHRDVGAIVWFDTNRPKRGPVYDWRLEASERTLQEAGDILADRWFGGRDTTVGCPG